MNCEQTRTTFEKLAQSGQAFSGILEAEAHLAGCSECQEWCTQELEVTSALGMLGTLPVSSGFTGRVLGQLPDDVPILQPAPAPVEEPRQNRLADFWHLLKDRLERPTYRRRLTPVLAVALSVVLALSVLLGLWEGGVSITPGTALGPLEVIGGVVLLAAVVAVVWILQRRK